MRPAASARPLQLRYPMSLGLDSLAHPASSSSAPDILALLAADHLEISLLFAAAEQLARDPEGTAEAGAMVARLIEAITRYAKAEEHVVYAECAESGVLALRELAREGWHDHDGLAKALRAVACVAAGPDGRLIAALRVAHTLFERHREAEGDELFETLDLAFSPDERLAMGRALVIEKERLRAEDGVPVAVARPPVPATRRAACVR